MRIAASVLCLSVAGLCVADPAAASIDKKKLNVPAEALHTALQDFSNASGLHVLFIMEDVDSRRSAGVAGELTPDEGLRLLLQGTGLTFSYLDDNTVTIMPGHTVAPPEPTAGEPAPQASGIWQRVLLAQAGGAEASVTNNEAVAQPSVPRLEEIVVTAEKREERQQDVPIAMTVLDPRALAETGQKSLLDYFASVPGLNVSGNAKWGGTQYITIRGISAGLNQAGTVATVIDDVPVAASTYLSLGATAAPDLDPSDLERIEILKGPQGTLYGADSLSGLIKYVTATPSLSGFSGRAQVEGVDIPDGGVGYTVRGATNVPLSDVAAVRVSAFGRRDPGYIDEKTAGDRNFNSGEAYGGQFSALLKPSESFSAKLNALVQNKHGYLSAVDSNVRGQLAPGDLRLTSEPNTTGYMTQSQVYSATLEGKLAGLDIVSVTGYVVSDFGNQIDFTGSFFGSSACGYFPNTCRSGYGPAPIGGAYSVQRYNTRKVSQEVRISSSIGRWLDWRVGGFYTHESTPDGHGDIRAFDLVTDADAGRIFQYSNDVQFHEYAGFADFTAHVTDRFDVQLGGRESWSRTAIVTTDTGAGVHDFDGGASSPNVTPLLVTSASSFTYSITPKLTISPDLMVYARATTGYRIGGVNPTALEALGQSLGLPTAYAPDRTRNYELGIKGELLEHKLAFDAAAYYIDWSDFQLSLVKDLQGYTGNAGKAKSQGLEASIQMRPFQGLTIIASGSYDRAVLTENLPPASSAFGSAGDRLPYSTPFSGALTVNQDIRLAAGWVGTIGATVNHVGPREFEFVTTSPTDPRPQVKGYTETNLHAGVRYNATLVNLYVNNIANSRGVNALWGTFTLDPGAYEATLIQPRTVGLGVSTTF